MPLYEYQCDACGHRFEQIRKFSDPPLDACPECGAAVRKLLSSPAIQFKGTGWYVTDYAKKKGTSGTAASEAGEAANGDKKTTEKTPAATKDTGGSTKTSGGSAAKPSSPSTSK